MTEKAGGPTAGATGEAPTISVIVPVRNDPGHLRACLAALRESTLGPHEVIVVDDASTDSTSDVAREMGARLVRLEKRRGPGLARNRGAEVAQGDVLFFVDADVRVHGDTVGRVARAFAADESLDAVFGSYDSRPYEPAFLSQYKNLFHHFVHQAGSEQASTFWAGCGAIRRALFLAMGGFAAVYERPCIEDIELGARLRRAGRQVVLQKGLQSTHLKKWSFRGILRSDVWDRAIPWTRLILRDRHLPNDLNLRLSQRISAALAYAFLAAVLAGGWWWPSLLLLPLTGLLGVLLADHLSSTRRGRGPLVAGSALLVLGVFAALARSSTSYTLAILAAPAAILLINRRFYAFFARERSWLFALLVVPMHLLYYLYSGLALVIGVAWHVGEAFVARSQRLRGFFLSSRTP